MAQYKEISLLNRGAFTESMSFYQKSVMHEWKFTSALLKGFKSMLLTIFGNCPHKCKILWKANFFVSITVLENGLVALVWVNWWLLFIFLNRHELVDFVRNSCFRFFWKSFTSLLVYEQKSEFWKKKESCSVFHMTLSLCRLSSQSYFCNLFI